MAFSMNASAAAIVVTFPCSPLNRRGRFKASARMVLTLRLFGGRPFRLPDRPFRKRPLLPRPKGSDSSWLPRLSGDPCSPSSSRSSAMANVLGHTGGRLRGGAFAREVGKGLAGFGVDGVAAGKGFPAADCDINIVGLDLEPEAASADALGRHDGRAGAAEGVQHDIPARRAILHGVGHKRDWLGCWMGPQLVHAPGPKAVHAGIAPDIRPVAASGSEFHIVEVRGVADPEDPDEFVLAAIEGSLSGV